MDIDPFIALPKEENDDFFNSLLGRATKVTSPENFDSFYKYDHLGRMIGKTTPDADGDGTGGPSNEGENDASDYRYKYDLKGNLRFVQDPNRKNSGGQYLYYKYDDLNRLIEAGVYQGTWSFDLADPEADWPDNQTSGKVKKVENVYEGSYLTRVDSWEGMSNDYTEYEYNDLGLVSSAIRTLAGLGSKTMQYEYDLQGKLVKISYQDGQSDAFYSWYSYDALGQLDKVKTNTDNNQGTATREAVYTYWPTGSVQQLKLGPPGSTSAVQTLDYRYNIRGSLLGINDPYDLSDSNSLGGDAFAEKLGYEDLTDIGSMNAATERKRYNGNISWLTWSTRDNNFGASHVGYTFLYDDVDRLIEADFGIYNGSWNINQSLYDVGKDQANGIEYKANGNIWKIDRNDENGSGSQATYNYYTDSNRLQSISGGSYPGSFSYDFNGNMLSGSGISSITYDYRNLPTDINTYSFRYDADGNRIYSSIGDGSYYVRGASGEVMAVYDGTGNLLYFNILAGGRVIGKMIP